MSLPVSLLKVLPTFKNTFESVDLRVAAVFQEGQWKNAISVFRLSHEPAENIRRRQQELQLIFGEVHGNALRFHFDVLASDKIQELIVAIQSGNLQVNGNSVTFGEVESFETQLASIDRGGMSIEGQEWSMYRSGYGQYQYQLLQSSSVLEEAHAYGASGPNELLNALFEEQLFAGGYPDRQFSSVFPSTFALPISALSELVFLLLSSVTRTSTFHQRCCSSEMTADAIPRLKQYRLRKSRLIWCRELVLSY
jgi:hypothetical protein